ncbi:MAG: isocitrate lyase/phosphoenolpyruvate mutase family protein [Candidatus Eremiobacteraeota bacterium]|nr:isocitrate lyase/phosphoenolpyruvate mutase family protein [Candidatus Eremiobacteraeota bacterium]
MTDQRAAAQHLRELHRPGNPVVFVNVWDAASARIVESLGFEAIATTSAGVAFSEGYPDGERIGMVNMLAAISRVCRAVDVPVSADLEGGYGETVDEAIGCAKGAIAAGAAGLNFEDGKDESRLLDARVQAGRIAAMRRVCDDYGVPLVINARTDVFLAEIGPAEGRMREAIARGRLYREAGADCIFVPAVTQPELVAELVRELDAPLNVLAGATAPPVAELARLGVSRISYGSNAYLQALTAFRDLAKQIRERGTLDARPASIGWSEANALFD